MKTRNSLSFELRAVPPAASYRSFKGSAAYFSCFVDAIVGNPSLVPTQTAGGPLGADPAEPSFVPAPVKVGGGTAGPRIAARGDPTRPEPPPPPPL